jgi:hypothetical protein
MTHAAAAVDETSGFQTLEQVFRWAVAREPRFLPGDAVIQDEFTHDVIFRAADGSALVFDTT